MGEKYKTAIFIGVTGFVAAAKLNMTYEEINIWIFVIIEPIVFVALVWIIYKQYVVIKLLKATLLQQPATRE